MTDGVSVQGKSDMRRRYRQVKQPDGSHKLVEITSDAALSRGGVSVFVQPDLNFKSPVDGSAITSHAQLREHNVRHNVIHESEMGSQKDRDNFYARKAAERADLYQNTTHTAYGKQLQRERKQAIADVIRSME